jgi:hypothetical protein
MVLYLLMDLSNGLILLTGKSLVNGDHTSMRAKLLDTLKKEINSHSLLFMELDTWFHRTRENKLTI